LQLAIPAQPQPRSQTDSKRKESYLALGIATEILENTETVSSKEET